MKLSKYLPTCATCNKNFIPNTDTIQLEVEIFPVIKKGYLFCSRSCFNQMIDKVRSKPMTDGLLYVATIDKFFKATSVPEKWIMQLKTSEIQVKPL